MIISVTEQHIKKGKIKRTDKCPIALAIKNSLPGVRYVRVTANIISVGDTLFSCPRSVFRFIRRFDNKKPVKSFNFKLEKR